MSEKKTAETPGAWVGEIEGHLWAMRPESLASLYQLAATGTLTAHLDAEAIDARRQRGRPRNISGSVQTVPLKGVLAPMGGLFALLFGDMNPLDDFRSAMREAMADDDVGAIIVEVDSPGGVVDHIPEAAAELRAMRGRGKPIVAVANTLAASAAYWIASQADEVVVTPSGAVGSIGVYATHRDMSGAFKLMGVENTLISAGKYKTDGNPFEPLSDSAREAIQKDVDDFYTMFVNDVAKGRGARATEVRSGFGEGRVLNSKRALAEGLVDRIETLSETASRLSSRSRGATTVHAEADEPERKLEAAEADAGADDTEVEDNLATADEAAEETAATEYNREERERIFDALGV